MYHNLFDTWMVHLEYQVALMEVSWQKLSFFQHENKSWTHKEIVLSGVQVYCQTLLR
jgi:hypothetical protein